MKLKSKFLPSPYYNLRLCLNEVTIFALREVVKGMNIIFWVVLGAISGWIASIIMGTNARQGLLMDIILGIVGAFVGGLVMSLFGQEGVTGFNIYSFIVAVVGAVIVIGLGRALTGGPSRTVERV